MEQNDIMQAMLKTQKKTLFHARLRTLLAILCAAVFIIGGILTLRSLRTIPDELSDVLAETKQTMISTREAVERSKEVDIDAVNDALTKLGAELDRENGGGLAGALDNISRLDPDAINNLLIRIDDVMVVMDRLSAVLERIGSLFGH
ncbi:MAG: hypothetical protein IK132_07590 [Clostridia bacterium]|nr:hypothetical protein [Clostridia bacterium]